MTVDAVLEVAGLGGGYTKAPVLRSVDVVVHADEVVGLLGANGAGKTTLLRALSGSLPLCTGTVRVAGRDVTRLSPWARVRAGLVHVPEGRHVFGAMTVQENLQVAQLARRGAVPLDDVYSLFPKLAERRAQLAGSLSGGEQQMLVIGRALVTKPRVLVVDEMSAGLAPVMVDQLVDGLARLRGSGTAVLLVEQSPHFVAELVDRVYLLEQGGVVGSGTLAALGGAARLADMYLGVS